MEHTFIFTTLPETILNTTSDIRVWIDGESDSFTTLFSFEYSNITNDTSVSADVDFVFFIIFYFYF